MKIGKVQIKEKTVIVKYKFVNDDEIFCIDKNGNKFYTHYKSLIV